MAEYTLYAFAQSGNAYKPALMLELAGADWAPRFVDYFGGETRTPEYRAINVMGEAPVLEHRGLRLTQSGVILDYLAGTLGRFGPRDGDERREVLRWLLFDNHKLTSYTATYRFMRTFAQDPDPGALAEFRRRAEAAWGVLDAHLAGRHYVVGDGLTIADLSLAGYLFWPDEIGVDWSAYPNIAAWLARIAATPRWRHPYELLPGHPRPAAA
ncbi:MAG: glutathione S-transferase C-terminal domain-containing protein [Betaproteobacteria bacterium]|nr:glutathione S-transferase C-terminal domain-containing protein [Betaproteobacteria bacterium]